MKEYARDIKLHAGDDETLAVRIRDTAGVFYDLTGCSATIELKYKYKDESPILTKTATFEKWSDLSEYLDTLVVDFTSEETASLVDYTDIDELGDVRPVYGVYDIEIRDENNVVMQILYGSWVAVAEVTR